MGCNRSKIYHDNELGVDHKDLALTTYEMQKIDIIHDLDTDNDQKGRVAVDCIFRPTREIYGQRALDMAEQVITWSKYGISFRKRPFPHDFPAFAHEKPAAELANLNRLRFTNQELQKCTESSEIEKMREMEDNENVEDVAHKQWKNEKILQNQLQRTTLQERDPPRKNVFIREETESQGMTNPRQKRMWNNPVVAGSLSELRQYTASGLLYDGPREKDTFPSRQGRMCVTFIYLNDKAVDDPKSYQLIVLNNRDELFDRPTLPPAWQDGRDQADSYGGTWLGMTRNGRLGNILAVLENPADEVPCAVTRGKIVCEYLKSDLAPESYVVEQLSKEAQQYNGFNAILLHREEVERKTYFGVQFSNRYGSPTSAFGSGVYGFGNSALGKPFRKITYGLRLFKEKLKMLNEENVNEQELMKHFLDILIDQTRSHTIVLVNGVGRCTYFERSRKQLTAAAEVTWDDTTHYFDLDDL
uniref:Uncharacterized protein n=1 Tax=Setaria digitata TaxID=48799 RepID=A0A915PS40_9BILA